MVVLYINKLNTSRIHGKVSRQSAPGVKNAVFYLKTRLDRQENDEYFEKLQSAGLFYPTNGLIR
ncbi:hypothetical protein BOW35_03965 [Solemya velum gill symbiont]|nr:hypothetical protein BOW35_03965 [Solemya velum gill symbiont]